ncbi:MAG: winged helix-turn-helix domain-containing protein, partial [Candidatus Levybacteria bacterium]|nr:winged helix-turn-helix domain-containing protein [Candidatus Levybacteria bacterium]
MQQLIIEAQYPLIFRKEESKALGEHIKKRHSVVLIGMKRVGISNFLRFFLYHGGIKKIYIQDGKQHFFIPVDLNDLVEREVSFFWTLTLKRIVDEIEKSALPQEAKNGVKRLFLDSMKSQDLFLTIDSVRKALVMLSEAGVEPTLFFIRFDRIKDALNPEFFANLEGLRDATHQKLAYIFTSFRRLNQLSPTVFGKAALQGLFDIVDGYVQYLQLALIVLHEQKPKLESKSQLFDYLVQDERIILQSEELWESLDSNEQEVLNKINRGEEINAEEKEKASYLWETGFIAESNGKRAIFNALFDFYVKQKTQSQTETNGVEFTKKENLLFIFLKDHLNEVCEREQIIEAVWPEVEALGVSDWAIDRLVARARSKLNKQGNKFEIQT